MADQHIVIYHNKNCSKSRQTLAYLRQSGLDIEVIDYLTTPPSVEELANLIKFSGLSLSNFIRENEPVYQALPKSDLSNDEAVLQAMVNQPILIQRPIVKYNQQVIIARPPECVFDILPGECRQS